MAKVFVITGPSGVGKGTLISELLRRVPDLELSISATTRAPREGEVDGRGLLPRLGEFDPFDRLLVAQVEAEGVPIVTRDPAILAHGPATIW